MSNDTISDVLTQIRNAIAVKHRFVIIPKTRMSLAITKVLQKEGYILSYEEFEKTNTNNAIFATTEELISYLDSNSLSNSLILLKGSRGIQLEKVLEMKNI